MIPAHVGIIMDGNGRWAVSRGLSRKDGYAYGYAALLRVTERARELGVRVLSVYAFSAENVKRPDSEIRAVFDAVSRFLDEYQTLLPGIAVRFMGDAAGFPAELKTKMSAAESAADKDAEFTLNIALNYDGREDVVAAAAAAAPGGITRESLEKHLGSAGLPPLDLIIRTGGEKRLSGFMLYEAAYAELIFCDKLWPDVTADDFDAFVGEFGARNRKFGA